MCWYLGAEGTINAVAEWLTMCHSRTGDSEERVVAVQGPAWFSASWFLKRLGESLVMAYFVEDQGCGDGA